jgi:hypothetical protein
MIGSRTQWSSKSRRSATGSVDLRCDSITQQSYGAELCLTTVSAPTQPQSFGIQVTRLLDLSRPSVSLSIFRVVVIADGWREI